jgi:hypothetical protein
MIRIIEMSAALFVLACGGGGGTTTTQPQQVASVVITPASASVAMGHTTTLAAATKGAAGETLAGRTIAWSSSAVPIATVSSAGVVTGIAPGTATITATSEGKSATASITVTVPTTPQARWLAAMVYDDAQNRVLMFGGFTSNGSSLGPLNDLWAWDGARWSFLGVGGPPARGDMLAAWDSARRRFVIYGGADNDGPRGDTWEWDGTAWTQRATGGPSIRRHFAGGFDGARGRVVLYGGLVGTSDTPALDTWEWDGQQWAQRATTTPGGFSPPAPASNLVYSETRRALLMLVGTFTSGPSALWQWNGSTWTSVGAGPTTSMPVPIAATGADEITLLLQSGATLRWQGSGFTQVAAAGPPSMLGSVIYDRAHARLVHFGGLAGSSTTAETWLWDGSTWALAPGR